MRLTNKVAIITGGARGIGRAVAELFAKEGATVVIWDILDSGAETAKAIRAAGGKVDFRNVSVTDYEQVEAEAKQVFENHGRIDILINNAGVLRDKTLLKMSNEEWETSIDINLKGIFYCTRAVVPYMRQNNYGRIVSAASTSGLRGNYGQSNYAAAKSGIVGMTKTWALELGRYGITANAVAPGYTDTEMTASIPQEVREMVVKQIPVGFVADPIDIAYGYLYLASDEARYVSGACLTIDGGLTR